MFDRAGLRKYLNQAERSAFLRGVEKEQDALKRTLALVLLHTGCRLSEALNCTWERIDFTSQALVFETLKRRARGHFRPVPIPRSLLHDLGELEIPAGSDGRIWPISRATAYRWIKREMERSGIYGPQACPRGLRHGHAIACVASKVPLTVIKKWLGHARLETTEIYLDVLGKEERALAKRLWRKGES